MNWISTEVDLPNDGEYVLVQFKPNKYEAFLPQHPEVAEFVKGLSLKDREAMKRGELEDYRTEFYSPAIGLHKGKFRSDYVSFPDEGLEKRYINAEPYVCIGYGWKIHNGMQSFFGQAVSHWARLGTPEE